MTNADPRAASAYHEATKHSPESVRSSGHVLDWANQPLPFKVFPTLEPIALPGEFKRSHLSALEAIAGCAPPTQRSLDLALLGRLCYFANGVTRVLHRAGRSMQFRAAASTGALYHVELYVICAELGDLAAGVYHYSAHDNALRRLRTGDYRRVLVDASGAEPSVVDAPVVLAYTTTFWRNAWKYQARAYRHAFWDTGTILANELSVAGANGVGAQLVLGFADDQVNRLLDVDPTQEAAICLVSLGGGATNAPPAPRVEPLGLVTQRLSARQVDYPAIVAMHAASSLASGEQAAAWRAPATATSTAQARPAGPTTPSIEEVILRRGSTRRFSRDPINLDELTVMLASAARPLPSDVAGLGPLTQPYLIVNAVEGLSPGSYVFERERCQLDSLRVGEFREQARFLDLGQDLGGDAAVNLYWLADVRRAVDRLGNRGYRAAQLEGAVEGGKLYLAAYALGLGATGLTFFDDDVTRFFSPHAADKGVMFLTAVGHPARSR